MRMSKMSKEITDAFKKVIDRKILDVAYTPLSTYIEDNYSRLDLTYRAKIIENVEQATLMDFELVRVTDITQNNDKLMFQVVVDAEIEIEEIIRRDREVEGVNKWFVLSCSAEIDDISNSFAVESIRAY